MSRFLIIQTAFIGDVVLTTPVVERIREAMPEAHIDILVRKGNESLLLGHPLLDEILVWDKKKNKYRNLVRMILKVRRRKYDAVINLQRFASTGLITLFSGAPYKSGFDSNPFSWSFSHKVHHRLGKKGDQNFLHETNRNLLLLEGITRTDAPAMKLYPGKEHEDKIDTYVSEPFITVSPSSVWFTKQYPQERWTEFISKVPGLKIYLLGGSGDKSKCEEIRGACSNRDRIVNLAGALSFLESAALMKRSIMNYTNDSGPLHFASAVDAPVAAIFCSTIPEFGFGPTSRNSRVLQSGEELSCRPCGIHGRSSCPEGHFACSKIASDQLLNCLP